MIHDDVRACATATCWGDDTHLYYKNAISQNALSGHPEAQLGRLRALLASE